MRFVVVIALTCFCTSQSLAQGTAASAEQEPQTKVGTFIAKEGTVIVRGFSEIGTAKGAYGSSVTVEAHEAIDAATGDKVLGIKIEVGDGDRSRSMYVDYDEIESLIKGLDYIGKLDGSVTKLSDFQADYRTVDDLEFSTFSSRGDIMLAVEAGGIGSVTAFFKISELAKIRDLVIGGKEKLDAIRA